MAFDSGKLGRGQRLFVKISQKRYKTPAREDVHTTESYSMETHLVRDKRKNIKIRLTVQNFFKCKKIVKAWLLNRVHQCPRALWVADQ